MRDFSVDGLVLLRRGRCDSGGVTPGACESSGRVRTPAYGWNGRSEGRHDGAQRSPFHSKRLARSSPFRLGRQLHNTASVDPGGGKDPACSCADGQPLVAGSFVRDLSWADDFADPLWRCEFSDRFRFHRSHPDDPNEQGPKRNHRSRLTNRCGFLCGDDGPSSRTWVGNPDLDHRVDLHDCRVSRERQSAAGAAA